MIKSFIYSNKGKTKVSERLVLVTEEDDKYLKGLDLSDELFQIETLPIAELEEIESAIADATEEVKKDVRLEAWAELGFTNNFRCFLKSNIQEVL